MIAKKRKFIQRDKDFIPHNNFIRAKSVRVIDNNNNNLGVIPLRDALGLAQKAGLDLVQISKNSDIPVCKITDYGKHRYNLSKRKKEAAKKQRENAIKVKEIKFRPCTDVNDLKTKASKAKEFLDDGNRIKISIMFRGREITHIEVARQTLKDFMDMVPNIKLISPPTMQGRFLSAVAGLSE